MADEHGEKTEKATAKRRADSRDKGEVAKSKEVPTVVMLLVGFATLVSPLGSGLLRAWGEVARSAWAGDITVPTSVAGWHALLLGAVGWVALAFVPFAMIFWIAAVASHLGQTGWLFAVGAYKFDFTRMNPLQGLKRLVDLDRLMQFAKTLVQFTIVCGLVSMVIVPALPTLMSLMAAPLAESLSVQRELAIQLMILMLVTLAFFAAIDVAYSRWQFERKLRMSKQEVRDEHKQQEGDPLIKGQIKARQLEMSRLRMIAEVATADVVVVNPTHYAVALRYVRTQMAAPRVVARGRNRLAERIRRVARDHGVPIVENPPLARLLYRATRVGREVPEHLFEAVAEVLAYVYRLDERRGAAWKSAG
ncbi:MAG: flagellar biosynthesis protein FlhB [Proteobacteria bacterium]|nr:flagellar biosynthesis protein FlhB [Pseudomonadota bacterium]